MRLVLALVLSIATTLANAAPGTWQAPGLHDVTARVDTDAGSFSLNDARYKIASATEPASDAFGDKPWTVLSARDSGGVLDLRLMVRRDGAGHCLVKLGCTNRSGKAQHLRSFVVAEGLRAGAWEDGRALQFGDRCTVAFEKGQSVGTIYASACSRPPLTAAFVSTQHYVGSVTLTPTDAGLRFVATDNAEGVLLPPGASRESEPLWLSTGSDPSAELERWGDLAGKWNRVRVWPRNMATWCSWYSGYVMSQCLGGALEKGTLANIPILAEKFLPLGLECARVVDDSLKRGAGDWPLATDALPSGYPAVAKAMRDAGLRPGFWYDSNRVGVGSKTAADHADWLALDAGGKLWRAGDPNWGYGDFYLLDASVAGARDFHRNCARKFRDAGERYCFTDFTGESIVPPSRSHNLQLTGVEVSRRAQEAVREGFGRDFYWLSQQTPAANVGLVDAMRTGSDSWGDNIRSYGEALSKWFMNRRLFLCDPDTWCVLNHSAQWDRDWGSYMALTGYAMTIGGDMRKLTPEREAMIRRLLPALNTTGRPRDLWERDVPAVLEQDLTAGGEHWKVVGLFNWREVPVHARVNLDRLFDEKGTTTQRYVLYDFWPEAFAGECGGSTDIDLPQMGGRVIAIRVAAGRPQILSIGDHIGQGVEELRASAWDARRRVLAATTHGRRGVADTTVRLRVPGGWTVRSVTADGKPLTYDCAAPEVCRFTVPDRREDVRWQVAFSGPSHIAERPERLVEPGLLADLTVDPAALRALREGLPERFERMLGSRAHRMPEGYELAFYARPDGILAMPYERAAGFGTVRAQVFDWMDMSRFGLPVTNWFEWNTFAYRVDDLAAGQTYRAGFTLFDPDTAVRRVDVVAVRASDDREFILARDVQEQPMATRRPPHVLWYDLPAEAIDPSGIIFEVRHKAGANAVCGEIWIARRTPTEAPPLDEAQVDAWRKALPARTAAVLDDRAREVPAGFTLRYLIHALDPDLDVEYTPGRGEGRLYGNPFTWDAPPPAEKIRFDDLAVEYRFDGLDATKAYRLGLVTYDDKSARRVNLVLRRVSDNRETVVLADRPAPSALNRDPASILWADVAPGLVDPAGTIVSIENAGGPNATMAELWVCEAR